MKIAANDREFLFCHSRGAMFRFRSGKRVNDDERIRAAVSIAISISDRYGYGCSESLCNSDRSFDYASLA
jgi:hypothetical protein